MNVNELSRVWGLEPNGVLHVGAHLGEEALEYEKHQWLPVTWIEAQPALATQLAQNLDPEWHNVINAAVWDEDDIPLKLNIASNSQSSSLFPFGTHKQDYPEVTFIKEIMIETRRLDSIFKDVDVPSFLNLDIQGAEGMAIKGLGEKLQMVDAIYTEVNRKEVYLSCTTVDDLDEYLQIAGFKRVATRWIIGRGWGDALYLRRAAYKISLVQRAHNTLLASLHVILQLSGLSRRALVLSVRSLTKKRT